MNIAGMMRVKNEARWIAEAIRSVLPVCSSVFVFDDDSTDGTPAIAERIDPRVKVIRTPYAGHGVDEARDKNYLLRQVLQYSPSWILHIDGDEVLEARGRELIESAIQSGAAQAYSLHVVYLWDRPDQIRVDGIYRNFRRPSLFSTLIAEGRSGQLSFGETKFGGNFHCGNVPIPLRFNFDHCWARLKHYGYMDRATRLRKYEFYNTIDPDNLSEDRYRHMVQGDVSGVPSDAVLKHAGPLKLTPWID